MNELSKKTTLSNTIKSALITAVCVSSSLASAATPTASYGNALITGTDNQITVSRVPVVNSAGQVSYQDLNMKFDVAADGTLNLAPFNPVITTSPNLVTSGFKPGLYKDSRNNKYSVTGPSVIPGTTRSVYSLALVSGADASQFSMSFITGSAIGHPNESSLITARNITSTAYSWGMVGNGAVISGLFPFNGWLNANVVGAAQAGTQLVLHYFKSGDNIEDASVSLSYCTTAC